LELTDQARGFLADTGFDPVYGARPLKRAIQHYIQDPLSMKILEGSITEGSKVLIDVKDGEVVFK
jgi:ATP-dependent Clp protease ATP-binding subunit ClpB